MALEFIDSFAHYGTGNNSLIIRKWTHISGLGNTIGNAPSFPVRANGFSMAVVGNVYKTLAYKSTRTIGVACYYPGTCNRGNPITFMSGGTSLILLQIEGDNTLSVRNANGTVIYNTGTDKFVITADTFHYYEITVSLSGSNPINADCIVNVDGKQRINTTGNTGVNANSLLIQSSLMNQFNLGGALGGGNTEFFTDLYVLNNDTTDIFGFPTTNTGFLGDVSIFPLVPVQDVLTEWQGSAAGPHFKLVNEIPPDDDTTYIFSDNVGNRDTFLFQPITGFNGTIFGAQLLVYIKKDGEGSRAFQPMIGSNTFDVDNYLYDYYDYFHWPMDSNNGTLWTPSNFNTQSFGAELTI